MKLTNTDIYDVSQISDTTSYQELQDFIDYVNNFNRDIVKSYFNNITLSENLKSKTLSLSVTHGQTIELPGVSNFVISNIDSLVPIRSYYTYRNANNNIVLQLFFDTSVNVQAKQALHLSGNIIKYKVRDTSNIKLGDFVTYSGFLTQSNNGTFQCIYIDTTNSFLYCINYNRANSTDDEYKTGFSGDIPNKYNISITFLQ